jgi:hypothetical protein
VKSTQVDGIAKIKNTLPLKKIKNKYTFYKYSPPPRIIAGIVKIVIVNREAVHLYENPPWGLVGKVANNISLILIIELKFYNSLSLLSGAVAP